MCNCVAQANAKLAKDNTQIEPIFAITGGLRGAIGVRTSKVDTSKRGKPKTVMACFCPFCGSDLKMTVDKHD